MTHAASVFAAFISYRRILQMTYQPKSAGKMVDFEASTLCIFLNSSQKCRYFFKHFGYRVLAIPDEKFDSQLSFARSSIKKFDNGYEVIFMFTM